MGTSNVLKVLKIAQAVGDFQNITSDHKSRNAQAGSYDFLFIIFSTKFLKRATFYRVVRARIPPVLGLVFFQSPMFAKHSTRSV